MSLHQKNVISAEEISNPSYRGYRKDPIAHIIAHGQTR